MLTRVVVLSAACASALQLPTASSVETTRVAASSASLPLGRRQALAAVGGAAFAAIATAANAYDSLPEVTADFEAAERQRQERLAKSKERTASLKAKLKPLEDSKSADEFVAAADALALWVIAEKSIPEGIKVKDLVRRITEALEGLPKKGYLCEPTRSNNGVCFSAGREAEGAYEALIKQIRKYSVRGRARVPTSAPLAGARAAAPPHSNIQGTFKSLTSFTLP